MLTALCFAVLANQQAAIAGTNRHSVDEYPMPNFYQKGQGVPYMPGAGKPLLDQGVPVIRQEMVRRTQPVP